MNLFGKMKLVINLGMWPNLVKQLIQLILKNSDIII